MTVFKAHMLMIKRNLATILMYIAIFAGISVLVQFSYVNSGVAEGYSAARLDVAVIDRDGGLLSGTLKEMLAEHHNLTDVKDEEQVIQEELYYGNIQYVLVIPEGAMEKLRLGGQAVQSITVPGTAAAYYAEAQVNAFLNEIRICLAGGFGEEEACAEALALSKQEADIELVDMNGNAGIREAYNYYYGYMPYAFLGASVMSMSVIVMEFKKRDIRRRMQSSALPLQRQNLASLASFVVVGALIWGICILLQAVLYDGGIFRSGNAGYYVLNSLVFMAVAQAIAYLTGIVADTPVVLNGMNNVISLGLCFLGGIFVPIEMLGEGIERIACFLPTYWYSKINGILGDYGTLGAKQRQTVRIGFLIQLLFAAAVFAVTLALRRRQLQERE